MNAAAPILVLGGTGFLGRSFCARWVRAHGGAGARLSVATRRLRRGRDEGPLPLIDVIEADIHDDETLRFLVSRHAGVVNLVGRLHGSPAEFERTHVDLPRRIAQACAAAGGRRVVHVSALGVGDGAPSHYLRTKGLGEQALRSEPAVALTVLRPSVMFGDGDRFMNLFARLQAVFPVMPLACAHARFHPVWVEDVAGALVQACDRPEAIGRTYECAGPQVGTLEEIVRMAGRWSGHARPVLALPDGLGRLQAALLRLLPGEPLLSADNLDSMKVDNVARGDGPGLRDLGIDPAPMDAVMPQVLDPDHLMVSRRAAAH